MNIRILIGITICCVFMNCNSQSQERPGKVRYDKKLNINLESEYVEGEGITIVTSDSGQSDTSKYVPSKKTYSAHIIDGHGAFPMDDCEAFLKSDTLFLEFKSQDAYLTDKLIIKVFNDTIMGRFVRGADNIENDAQSVQLTLKNKIKNSGDVVVGQVVVDVFNSRRKRPSLFTGVFRCTVK